MEKISLAQLKCAKTLIGKLTRAGNEAMRDVDALALGFSSMRTTHISELWVVEGIALIRHLKSLDKDEVAAEKMRRKIIGMAYMRAGLAPKAEKLQKQAVVNWLNGWCKQYGYKHKALNSYTKNELPKLVTQFELVLKDLLIEI